MSDDFDWNVPLPLWPDPEPAVAAQRIPAHETLRPKFLRFRPANRVQCGDCLMERHLGLDVAVGAVRWKVYIGSHSRGVCERHKREIEERQRRE